MLFKLEDVGINTGGRTGEIKTLCPKCSHTRKKKNDPCLSVNTIELVWNCFNCSWTNEGIQTKEAQRRSLVPNNIVKTKKSTPYKETPLEDLSTGAIEFFEKRGISEEVLRREQIKVSEKWFPQTKDMHKCIAFPFFKGNKRVATKYRDHKKNMTQDAGGEKCFYRFDEMKIGKNIYITEGEIDALTLVECGFSDGVTSVPDGAPNPTANNLDNKFSYFTEEAMKIFDDAERVYLVVDNDENGRFLESELKRRIGVHKCLLVDYPVGCKDINDVLLKLGHDAVSNVIENAELMPIDGVKTFRDFKQQIKDMRDGVIDNYYETGCDDMDKHLKIKTGQLNIVTGSPGCGKSEWVDEIMVNTVKQYGLKWIIFTPENNPPNVYFRKLASKYCGKSFDELSDNEVDISTEHLSDHIQLLVDSEDEDISIDYLLNRVKEAVFRHGIKGVVLDPWNEILNESGAREDLYISKVLRRIKRFSRKYELTFWIVAHPKNPKMLNDGSYPRITAYDIVGGYAWFAKADNLFSLWRDKNNLKKPVEVNIQKIKQKTDGREGICYLHYQYDSGNYIGAGSSLDEKPICEDMGGVNVNGIEPDQF